MRKTHAGMPHSKPVAEVGRLTVIDRQVTSDRRHATSDERRAASDERRATSNEQRATSDEQRATSDEQQAQHIADDRWVDSQKRQHDHIGKPGYRP